MKHHLKTATHHFIPALLGLKQAEVRIDDRDYQEGDFVYLYEVDAKGNYTNTEPVGGIPAALGGKGEPKYVKAKITHVLRDFEGLSDGYCVLSLEYMDEIKKHNPSKSENDLMDTLIAIDAKTITQSFCLSQKLGVAAIKGALQGFREHIQETTPQFLASSNIMYRCYVVGLMSRINDTVNKEYQGDVARAFLLPENIQSKKGEHQ